LAKEEVIKLEGRVMEILPGAMFRVKLEHMSDPVIGVISGRMRQNQIKVAMGDTVEIEFSPYDLTRGRITRRK
jgi:translation initiation factor IF-1